MSLSARIRAASPPALPTLAGSLFWALAMSAGAGLSLYVRHWYRAHQAFELILIFFAGGLLAWPLARLASRFAAPEPESSQRIAANILCVAVATSGMTALVYGLYFRVGMTHLHDHDFSIYWIIDFILTVGAAVYQFLVLGLGLFLPALIIGVPAYLIWALYASRR
jgi:hypothetical protein